MKRLSLFFGYVLLASLVSCTNDDFNADLETTVDEKVSGSGPLPKKIIVTSNNGTLETTEDYVYNGSKLSKITSSNGSHVIYTYSGNQITQRSFYTNNVLTTKETFSYNSNGQLIGFKRLNPTNTILYQAVYQYNSDGTVSANGYRGATVGANSAVMSRKVYFSGSKISKIENYSATTGTLQETEYFTFDAKNTPFKNITGFNKLTLYDSGTNGTPENITKTTIGSIVTNDVQYNYNNSNFPVAANNGSVTLQFFY